MEQQTVDMVVGKKVDEATVKADAGKHKEVKGLPVPGQGPEVGGRQGMIYVRCPWDYAVNYVYEDDFSFIWYRCWHCGNPFKV
jgi:hypothetical protein